ncbi:hypothetical protein GCM10027256_26340 [Novispirillum itersonii subsp. nipponicum]
MIVIVIQLRFQHLGVEVFLRLGQHLAQGGGLPGLHGAACLLMVRGADRGAGAEAVVPPRRIVRADQCPGDDDRAKGDEKGKCEAFHTVKTSTGT